MSKESEAKEKQRYVPKAVPHTCLNCVNFTMDIVHHPAVGTWGTAYDKGTNLRCGIGGFKVMKMGTCNVFQMKGEPEVIEPDHHDADEN
jgi:hypothetical protein